MKAKDYILIASGIAIYLLWQQNKKATTTTGVTSTEGTTTGGATSNQQEQVFGLGLPNGMGLPVLTAGTGVPTEVAIQLGGVRTAPQPVIIHAPALETEQSLVLGGIKPIVKTQVKATPIVGTAELP